MQALQRRLNDIKSCGCPADCHGEGREPTTEEPEEDNGNNPEGNDNDNPGNRPGPPPAGPAPPSLPPPGPGPPGAPTVAPTTGASTTGVPTTGASTTSTRPTGAPPSVPPTDTPGSAKKRKTGNNADSTDAIIKSLFERPNKKTTTNTASPNTSLFGSLLDVGGGPRDRMFKSSFLTPQPKSGNPVGTEAGGSPSWPGFATAPPLFAPRPGNNNNNSQ